jgi:hypothetical protein
MERCTHTKSSMVDAGKPVAVRRRHLPMWRELVVRAMWLAAAFGIAQCLGLREWASALLKGAASSPLERVGCMTYLFLYGSFVVVVPTLVIAALLLIAWDRIGRRRQER